MRNFALIREREKVFVIKLIKLVKIWATPVFFHFFAVFKQYNF